MKIDVKINQKALEKAYQALRLIPGAFPRAVTAASNRTIETMRTDTVRETKERYFAKPGDIRKSITLKKAGGNNLSAVMLSRGTRKNISKYQITPKSPQAGRKNGFKGAVKRDGGLKPLPKGTFMINTPSAGPVLFVRTSKGKWGISHVTSPSIPQIIKNKETVEVVETRAQDTFRKRLNHEVLRLLGALP